jgi:hypothetical protein
MIWLGVMTLMTALLSEFVVSTIEVCTTEYNAMFMLPISVSTYTVVSCSTANGFMTESC